MIVECLAIKNKRVKPNLSILIEEKNINQLGPTIIYSWVDARFPGLKQYKNTKLKFALTDITMRY